MCCSFFIPPHPCTPPHTPHPTPQPHTPTHTHAHPRTRTHPLDATTTRLVAHDTIRMGNKMSSPSASSNPAAVRAASGSAPPHGPTGWDSAAGVVAWEVLLDTKEWQPLSSPENAKIAAAARRHIVADIGTNRVVDWDKRVQTRTDTGRVRAVRPCRLPAGGLVWEVRTDEGWSAYSRDVCEVLSKALVVVSLHHCFQLPLRHGAPLPFAPDTHTHTHTNTHTHTHTRARART
jgi:hypothetical protein